MEVLAYMQLAQLARKFFLLIYDWKGKERTCMLHAIDCKLRENAEL